MSQPPVPPAFGANGASLGDPSRSISTASRHPEARTGTSGATDPLSAAAFASPLLSLLPLRSPTASLLPYPASLGLVSPLHSLVPQLNLSLDTQSLLASQTPNSLNSLGLPGLGLASASRPGASPYLSALNASIPLTGLPTLDPLALQQANAIVMYQLLQQQQLHLLQQQLLLQANPTIKASVPQAGRTDAISLAGSVPESPASKSSSHAPKSAVLPASVPAVPRIKRHPLEMDVPMQSSTTLSQSSVTATDRSPEKSSKANSLSPPSHVSSRASASLSLAQLASASSELSKSVTLMPISPVTTAKRETPSASATAKTSPRPVSPADTAAASAEPSTTTIDEDESSSAPNATETEASKQSTDPDFVFRFKSKRITVPIDSILTAPACPEEEPSDAIKHTTAHTTRISSLAEEGIAWTPKVCDTSGHPASLLTDPRPEDWYHSWQLNRRVLAKWIKAVNRAELANAVLESAPGLRGAAAAANQQQVPSPRPPRSSASKLEDLLMEVSKFFSADYNGLFSDFFHQNHGADHNEHFEEIQEAAKYFLEIVQGQTTNAHGLPVHNINVATSYFNCASHKNRPTVCNAKLNARLWYNTETRSFFETTEGAKKRNHHNLHASSCLAIHKSRLPPSITTLRLVDKLIANGMSNQSVEEAVYARALELSGGIQVDDGRLLANATTINKRYRRYVVEYSKKYSTLPEMREGGEKSESVFPPGQASNDDDNDNELLTSEAKSKSTSMDEDGSQAARQDKTSAQDNRMDISEEDSEHGDRASAPADDADSSSKAADSPINPKKRLQDEEPEDAPRRKRI